MGAVDGKDEDDPIHCEQVLRCLQQFYCVGRAATVELIDDNHQGTSVAICGQRYCNIPERLPEFPDCLLGFPVPRHLLVGERSEGIPGKISGPGPQQGGDHGLGQSWPGLSEYL